MAKIPDVLVLGGGIIGLTSAYLLAKAGVNVEVFDRQEMGREASWAGAGILPPFGDVSGAKSPIDALRANSVAGFAALSEELESLTGRPTGYRITGGIEVLHPESEYCLPLWASEKIVHERIDKQTLTRLEPDAHTNAEDIYYLPGFAQVRNPWHLKALIAACEYQGVTLTPDCQFESWELADGRVRGLFDSSGRLREAGAYLIANGAWAEAALAPLGSRPGIHPVRGQIVLFAGSGAPLLSRVILDGKRYLVPRGDGRILAGSTEEPEAGFAKANTAEGLTALRRFAGSWISALAEAEVEQTWSGLRPTARDGLPSIGRVPGQDRVFAAVGHGRAGIQLSLGTAQLVLNQITGQRLPDYAEAFRLDRPPASDIRPAFRS